MKRFEHREVREARAYALEGGQALHVWTPGPEWAARAPAPFKAALRRGEPWAHLFDQDVSRLRDTVRKLGVRVTYIHHEGTPNQHHDLCGVPLQRAIDRIQPSED